MADSGTYANFETSEGKFKVRLFDKEAPKTVANFTGLVEGTKEWRDPASGGSQRLLALAWRSLPTVPHPNEPS